MKLTVIGCWGGYPKANDASSGYLVEYDGFQLLLDCGSGVLSKLQNVIEPEQLDAVVISHYHPDHVADIGVLQHARLIQGFLGKTMSTLPIYGHQLDKTGFETLTYKEITSGNAYNPNEKLVVGPFTIQFLQTAHPVPCFAMRVEVAGKSLVYTADTSYKPELNDFCRNADVLLCECNFYKDQDGKSAGHMTSYDAGNLAQTAGVRKLILTHLPHYGDLQQLKVEAGEKYSGYIELASNELVLNI